MYLCSLKYFNSLSSGYHHANPCVNSLPLPEAFLTALSSYNFNRTLVCNFSEEQVTLAYPIPWQASGFSKLHSELIITTSWTGPLPSYKQGIRRSHIQKQMPIHSPVWYSRLHKWQQNCTGTLYYLPAEIFHFLIWNQLANSQ